MDYDPDRSSIWMRNTGQPGDGLRRFGRDMNGGSISYNELKSWPPITESQRRISSYEWIIGDSRSVIPSTNLEKKYIRNQKKEDRLGKVSRAEISKLRTEPSRGPARLIRCQAD